MASAFQGGVGLCLISFFLFFFISPPLVHIRGKSAEGRFAVISTPYVMNFQIPLSHKIESIKSPVHHLPPTFLTLNLSSLEFYHFAQSQSTCSAMSWDSQIIYGRDLDKEKVTMTLAKTSLVPQSTNSKQVRTVKV